MPDAEELYARAQAATNAGRFGQARALLTRARAADPSPDVLARIDLTHSYVEGEVADRSAALASCRALLERPGLTPATYGLVWAQLGMMQMRGGDPAATSALGKALELLPAELDHDVARVLLNRGNVHLQQGAVGAAAQDFLAASRAFDRVGLEVPRAKAEHNLGYTRLLTGDLVGALQLIERAAEVLGDLSPAYRATVEQDRAEVLTAAGRPREAVRALEQAAAAYGARRLRTYQAECELTLSGTLLREDPVRARVVARRAARRFRSQSSPARALQADAVATLAEIAAGGLTRSLLERADALVADLHAAGHRRDADQVALQATRVSIARGDLDDAGRRLRRVRVGPESPVATRLLDREVRADLARARGDLRRAHGHVRAGLGDLHAWQSTFGSLDLQSTLVGHGRTLAQQGLRVALEDGRPAVALEWSERARALVGRVAAVRPPADEQLAADLAELRSLPVLDRRTADGRRAHELRERVRQRSWQVAGGGEVGEPVEVGRLQEALAQDDATLVAHVVVDDALSAVVVTGVDLRVVPLGPLAGLRSRLDGLTVDLTMAAGHRTGPVAEAIRGSLPARLDTVAAQLLAPLGLGDGRVVLTPAGALAGTPWTLLPGLAGRPVTVAPSATRWLDLRGTTTPARVAAVAGPGLERAEEEVCRVAGEWPHADVLLGPAATAEAVSDLASRVDLLHLAGHGTHPGENPLFASVALADGPWFGYDIDRLSSVPSTVVLSACELGRATVRSGEESVGMTAAWLHAGARTVVSSPVVIADDVACEALARWHALVAAGTAPADALAGLAGDVGDVLPLSCAGAGW